LRAEHDVLEPIGGNPTRRAAGFHTDAPRRGLTGFHALGQGLEFNPRLGDFVTGRLKSWLVVEHQSLDVDAVKHAVDSAVVAATQISPRRSVVLLDVGNRRSRQRRECALRGQVLHHAGLWDGCDIRVIAALHAHVQNGVEISAGRVINFDAGVLRLESVDDVLENLGFVAAESAEDIDRFGLLGECQREGENSRTCEQ